MGREAFADPPLTAEKARDSLPTVQRISIAIGAGIASALLFAVTVKVTVLALLLGYLAPLPIFIVSLGWGLDIGTMAGIIAGVATGAVFEPLSGALLVLTIALPAWILSLVALLPVGKLLGPAAGSATPTPIAPGKILATAVAISAAIGLATLISLTIVYGGYAKGVEALVAGLTPELKQAVDEVVTPPAGYSAEDFYALIVRLSPAAIAASTVLMLSINLYIGGRSVQLSHRLPRPWPNLPESLVLPPALGIALVAAAALSLLLPAPVNQLAWIASGALGVAYILQGLAVLHAISRGLPARAPLLAGLYLGSLITATWSLPILALVGLLDSLLSLRARRAAADLKPRT